MINYLKKKRKSRGFTLMELIVVIGIMSMLAGIIFLMPRESIDMDLTARKMTSDFRWIQNSAMVGYSPPGANKVYGFGIHTEEDGYTLYYSTEEDDTTYEGEDLDPTDKKIRDVKFPGGLVIEEGSGRNADVFYIPPDPRVIINGDEDIGSIDFNLKYKEETARIEISKGGLIEY